MLIDLHTHSTDHSNCSAVSPDDLVVAAKRSGLDGVAITEHDAYWPEPLVRELSEKHAFVVLRGIEVTTEIGHVLVFGVPFWRRGLRSTEALREFVQEHGGLMFLAHPARRYARPLDVGLAQTLFDSLETENGSENEEQNARAAWMAEVCALPGIGGSDAHTAFEVGSSATRLAEAVNSEAELVAELRRARHKAERIR